MIADPQARNRCYGNCELKVPRGEAMTAQAMTAQAVNNVVSDKGMSEKSIQAAVARFLKTASFTAQGEVEKAIRAAIASGKLKGHETFTAGIAVSSEKIGLNITIYNKIEL